MRDYKVDIICQLCGQLYIFYVDKEDLYKVLNREAYCDDVLDYLTDNERELILSKTCGSCFDKLMEDINED
tara:strand:- start:145 stop:357 length:213 start_codon:yes stop_codon:yes gene_type:complete